MSSTAALAPSTLHKPRQGLASIKTMFTSNASKRHSIAQMPSAATNADNYNSINNNNHLESVVESPSALESPKPSTASSLTLSTSSLFHNKKRSLEKAAEKERKEQAKQVFQLSTIDDQGVFQPPTPVEKGLREHEFDKNIDYFDTIISTPADKVRNFLSSEMVISPGLFSEPLTSANVNKRRAKAMSTSQMYNWSSSAPGDAAPSAAATAPIVPPKDNHTQAAPPPSTTAQNTTPRHRNSYSSNRQQPQQQQQRLHSIHSTPVSNTRRVPSPVQVSYTDAQSADIEDALSDSMHSSLSSPSSAPDVPDLMMDEDDGLQSSSETSSPRHSTNSLQSSNAAKLAMLVEKHDQGAKRTSQFNAKMFNGSNFGGDLLTSTESIL